MFRIVLNYPKIRYIWKIRMNLVSTAWRPAGHKNSQGQQVFQVLKELARSRGFHIRAHFLGEKSWIESLLRRKACAFLKSWGWGIPRAFKIMSFEWQSTKKQELLKKNIKTWGTHYLGLLRPQSRWYYLLFDLKTMKTMGWCGDVGFYPYRTKNSMTWGEIYVPTTAGWRARALGCCEASGRLKGALRGA
jgi:hypothetical protein